MGHKLDVHGGSGEKGLSDRDTMTPQEEVLDSAGSLSWKISAVFPERRLHTILDAFHKVPLDALDMEVSATYLVVLN